MASGRHVDLLIPTQHAGCPTDILDFAESFFQLF
jgi:hypothetical protein